MRGEGTLGVKGLASAGGHDEWVVELVGGKVARVDIG